MATSEQPALLPYLVVLTVLVAAIALRQTLAPTPAPPDVIASQLETELAERIEAVSAWGAERRIVAERIADDPALTRRVLPALEGASAPLDLLLGHVCTGVDGCALSRTDGTVLASYQARRAPAALVRAAARGRTVQSKLVAIDASGGDVGPSDDTRYAVFFATPVILEGVVRAVLTVRVGPDRELDPILGRRPPGRTGETYAVDPRGFMITRSRFDAQRRSPPGAPLVLGAPATWLHTPRGVATRALAALPRSGTDVDGYVDYRGVPVVGAWRWLEELGVGVVTEMDLAEARALRSVEVGSRAL